MVAIVTGNGVGLGKSSSEVLGQGGQLGLGQLPGAAGNAYVNASNGNLIIQRQDELLIGRGPDIGVYQTYNSQGTFDFDNNDNWQVSLYRQLSGLTGTVNAAGSTITRTAADGTPLVYTYDSTAGSATLGKYVNKDGSGSFDTLTYTSGSNTWAWQDGNTRIKESYAVDPTDSTKWRITSVTDLDNNSLTYTYSTISGLTTLIDKVTSANGEITQLIYNSSKQLTQINVINSSSVTTTRIRYTYESTATTARLTSVSTDLTPVDGSIADGKTYTTTYTYDGTSKRIASITNSDGSKVSFTYEQTGTNRLLTISDYVTNSSTINNTTTLNYTSATTTTVTNTNNAGTSLVTTLTYDTNKQLTNVQGPSGSGQNTSYTYNTNGDITQVTDNRGNWTKYTYDAQGNQLTQQDNLGNTVVRTYDSTAAGFNQLLTQTVYTGVDATPGDATIAGTGTTQTTRYTYDSKNHVRFTISAEGRVTEYRYNATNGQLTSTHQYTDNLFTTTGNQTEAQMNTWLTAAVKSKSQRTDYLYDARGQLSEQIVYTKVNATVGSEGNGIADGTQMRTQYVYDQAGNLKQKIDARGVATTGIANDYLTSYSYDGLNRLTLTKQYDQSGLEAAAVSTTVTYTAASRQVSLTLGNGLVTTSTYDLAGRLISVQKSDSVNTTVGSLGTTSYTYDKLGNLRMVTDPAGQNTYYLYDSANRKVGEIDQNKSLTEWVYNNNGQVIRTIQYKNAVTATLDASTALTNTLLTAGVRPTADATNDRTSYRIYDQAGRLSHEIDALGYVTESQYDGASRLLRTLEYNTVISAANLSLIQSSTTDVYGINGSIKGISGIASTNTLALTADATNDRANRNLYDNDGKLVGSLDAEGSLTEYIYDKAGRQTQKIRYATVTLSANWATADLATLRGNATAVSADTSKHQTTNYIYNTAGQLTGVVDAENYLTEYQYDLVGNKTQEIRYATSITYVAGNTVVQSRPASNNEDQKITNTYDANNRILSILSNTQGQVNGLLTNYTYDSVGNLTQAVKTFTGATSTQQRVQRNQYDSRGNLIAELSGEGVVALLALGATPTTAQVNNIWNNYATRYTYDAAGRLVSKLSPVGIYSASATAGYGYNTLYYYDNEGKLTYTVNALGEVSQAVYNSFDQVAETRRYNTRIASATLAGLTGGAESAVASAITSISAGGYSNIQSGYDKRGQTISTTDELNNINSRTYNAFGELNNRTDKIDGSTNVITSYQYDRKGLLKTTTEDAAGINRITQAVYDAFGRVTQTTDGRGNTIKHAYDRLGREVTTTDGLIQDTITTYDAFSRVLTRKDGRANTITYSYNAATRTMSMTTAEGVVVETVKNQFGETVSVKDGRGSITTYQYNADGQLFQTVEDSGSGKLNITTSTTYDTAGRVYETTDARGTFTRYIYDAVNRVLRKRIQDVDDDYDNSYRYRYDAQGRQAWEQDVNGIWTRIDYDAKGQVTGITVDPKKTADWVGGGDDNPNGLNITTSYTYNARGKKLTVIEGAGTTSTRTTQYVYDKLGRLTSSIVDPGTNKLNLTTTYIYDKNDNVVLKTDANNNKTVYTYDANNRLVYTVDALGYITKKEYDANGNIVKETAFAAALVAATLTTLLGAPTTTTITPVVDATNDRATQYVYDKDNRVTFKVDALNSVTQYQYDAIGNVVKTTRYAYFLTGTLQTNVPPVIGSGTAGVAYVYSYAPFDQVQQTVYDAANRPIYTIDAEKYVTRLEYDISGNVIKKTRYATALAALPVIGVAPSPTISGKDQVTEYAYDGVNRVVLETRASGSAEAATVNYEYDALGNQISIIEASGTAIARVTQQKFDAAGRKTEVIDANGKSTKTEYNAVGDIVKVTDALGNVGYFYTDAAGRVTLQVDPEGAVTQSQYDGLGNATQVLRFANKVQTSGTGVLSTSASIQIVSTAPGGNSVYVLTDFAKDQKQTTEYDKLGQKLTVKTWTGLTNGSAATDYYTESYTYSAFGDALTKLARNGALTTFTYDRLSHLKTETLPVLVRNNTGNGMIALVNEYSYDAFGNLGIKREAKGALTYRRTYYEYNQRNLLVHAYLDIETSLGNVEDDSSLLYKSYDARGNLIADTDANGNTTSYYYDKQDRRTASVKADGSYTAWTYDALGNISQETRYSNKIQTIGTPIYAASVQVVSTAPTSGNSVYVITDTVNDRITEYKYDKVGRQTETKITGITTGTYDLATKQYSFGANDITTKTDYDALGNILRQTDGNGNVTRSWYNKAGQLVAKLDTEGYVTLWDRDVYGNISRETRYANKVQLSGTATLDSGVPTPVDTAPGGNSVFVLKNSTDDRITNIVYDKLNRVSTETVVNVLYGNVDASGNLKDANGTSATTGSVAVRKDVTTSYLYDGLNNITQKTDASSAVTNWVYDGLGRQLGVINPQFTDFEGNTVRTRTDKEYNGLNNVIREIRRGADNTAAATISGQVETDDQITTYTYGIGGYLLSETDATGAETQYEYDLNGNLITQTLRNRKTINQVINNQAGADDVTIYSYDVLNRQVKTTDLGTGVVQEVRYNSFNQITGKRTYTGNAPAATSWDEYTQYDKAGKVWKSNSGDGVTKVYVNDRNGNTTVSISGTLNMNSLTLEQVLAQKQTDTTNNTPQQTLYTFSTYDKRNQLLTTVQPSMDGTSKDVKVVKITDTNQSLVVTGSTTGTVTITNMAANPIVSGNIVTGFGNVAWSYSWYRAGGGNYKSYYLVPSVTIPSTLGLDGNTRLEITAISTNRYTNVTSTTLVVPQGGGTASTAFFIGSFKDASVSVTLQLKLVHSTSMGDVVLGEQTYSGGLGGGNNMTAPNRLYIANQPYVPGDPAKSTSKLLLAYRPLNSNTPYTVVPIPEMVNTTGTVMGGMYSFDWSSLAAGNYEFQYVALNNAGQILNQQSGTFDTSNPQAPVVSNQAAIPIGGSGRAFIVNATQFNTLPTTLVSPTGKAGFMRGGVTATQQLAYVGSDWAYYWDDNLQQEVYYQYGTLQHSITLPALIDTNAFGDGQTRVSVQWSNESSPQSFVLNGNSITSTTSYYMDASYMSYATAVVSIYKTIAGHGEILVGQFTAADGSPEVSFPFSTKLILRGQPNNTQQLKLYYRPLGNSGAYSVFNASQLTNAGSAVPGLFTIDSTSLAAQRYEIAILALDSSGNVLNQQTGILDNTAPSTPSIAYSTVSSGLQLINQGTDATSVTMRYRLKNTNGTWITPTTSFIANSGFGIGSFVLDPAGLSGMTNGNEYDVEYVIKNSSGVVLRTTTGTIKKDSTGFSLVGELQAPSKLTFTQPTTATKLSIRYKTLVSPEAYTNFIILDTVGNGKFEWDPSSLISNIANTYDYDFDIEARNADGILVNHNQVNLRLGATTTQLASQNIALPQVLRIKPSQTGISYVRLSYRVKGSTANYTALNVNVTASTNADTSKEYRFELPATLTAGDYEYTYTAYATDTTDANGDTVRNALGSATGYFTAGSTGTASRLDWVIQTSTNVDDNSIKRSQTYNAFGEIVTETNGRDKVTTYTYNTMGAMTRKVAPTVSVTAENGAVNTNATPTTEYTYDAIGRVIAVKDANGNVNTQAWLAGSNAEGSITLEKHADGGVKAAGFDIFGNKRAEYDELTLAANRKFVALSSLTSTELANRIDYTYDKENRLVKVERQKRNDNLTSRSTDQYTYDAAGNRISHINAANDTEKTFYDSLGRVTKTTSFMNFDTNYAYTYVNDVVGVGGATVSGWQKVTTDATQRTLRDKTDMFNHVTWHQDLGGRQFTYVYNQAGWLTNQTSLGAGTQFSGQNIEYSYYNNGNIKAIHDKAVGMYTYYEYDKDGNRTFEGYISLKEAGNFAAGAKDYYQYARIEYDAMNRMISVVDPKASILYEYDAVGNRRMVKSTYHDGVNGSMKVQEYWYKYDNMNRFLITMGALSGARGGTSTITKGTTGVDITYNSASQRTQAINASDNTTEGYSYTNDGYLTNVTINGVTRSSRTNDVLGRVTTYQEFGGSNPNNKTTTYDKDNRVTLETGTYGRTDYFYYTDATDNTASASSTGKGALARTKNDSDGDGNDATGTIVNTYYAYQYWDDAKQFAITNQGYNATLRGNNSLWKSGYSELTYDVNGHLNGAVDRSGNRSFRYVNDAQGLILFRDEIAGGSVNRRQRYYYVDGKRVGDVGNDGDVRTDYVQAMANRNISKSDYKNWKPVSSADFDQNYEPINPNYPGFAATAYTVKNGDTLQSIARAVWGDADMWYLIADANGLTSGSTLTAGQVLTIPNKVTNIHNNSGTYRVYNPGEAIGDVNPILPTAPPPPKPKKKGGCGGFATIIVAVITVVATIYTAGLAAGASGAFGATMSAGAGALGMTAGVTASVGAAMVGGAVGSVVGQLAGNALGVQKGFSWGAVAAGAIGAGLGASTAVGGVLSKVPGGVVGQAIAGNLINQSVGMVTGTQKGFSWAGLATAAIAAPITNSINQGIKTSAFALANPLNSGIAGAVAGIATTTVNELTRITISGGKISWANVAIGGIQGGIYGYAQGLGYQARVNALTVQRQQTQNGTTSLNQVRPDSYLAMLADSRGTADVPIRESRDVFKLGEKSSAIGKTGDLQARTNQLLYENSDIIKQQGAPTWVNAETGVMGWALQNQPEIVGKPLAYGQVEYLQAAPEPSLLTDLSNIFNSPYLPLGRKIGDSLERVFVPAQLDAQRINSPLSFRGLVTGAGKELYNTFNSLNEATPARMAMKALGLVRPNPNLSIENDELKGAALFQGLSLVGTIVSGGAGVAAKIEGVGAANTVVKVKHGEFSIADWTGYPDGIPQPTGPFRLLEGADYNTARDAANSANKTLRKDWDLVGKPVDIHEIQPVKFGGSPTDTANKIIIDRSLHRQQVTPWWNSLQKTLEGK